MTRPPLYARNLCLTLMCVGAALTVGCATERKPSAGDKPPLPEGTYEAQAATLPHVRSPKTQPGARRELERGLLALEDGAHALAAARFRAVLRTDFLTDAGRVNVYRFCADAHRRLEDPVGERDCLGGLLISAALVDESADVENHAVAARARLAAIKVAADPGFGRSPEAPILVEDLREPAAVIATLRCGSQDARFVEVSIRSVQRSGERLLRRRAECPAEGRTIELWFDVTHARAPIGVRR